VEAVQLKLIWVPLTAVATNPEKLGALGGVVSEDKLAVVAFIVPEYALRFPDVSTARTR
jgi:hypothetical protein